MGVLKRAETQRLVPEHRLPLSFCRTSQISSKYLANESTILPVPLGDVCCLIVYGFLSLQV